MYQFAASPENLRKGVETDCLLAFGMLLLKSSNLMLL